MSADKITLANLHSQSAIVWGLGGLDTAALFVRDWKFESLARQDLRPFSFFLRFHLVEACWTNCQTRRIKNKSVRAYLEPRVSLLTSRNIGGPARCHVDLLLQGEQPFYCGLQSWSSTVCGRMNASKIFVTHCQKQTSQQHHVPEMHSGTGVLFLSVFRFDLRRMQVFPVRKRLPVQKYAV